jgi:glutaredoxin
MFALRLAALCAAFVIALPCAAATTYRWTNAAGETVYSDFQPPPGTKYETLKGGAQESGPTLPYTTRVAAEKYPVTLYTSATCKEVCDNARALLNKRGVPFSEKKVATEEELAEAGRQIGGQLSTVPSLKVGSQSFSGFEANAWNGLLDLAGYPASASFGSGASGGR